MIVKVSFTLGLFGHVTADTLAIWHIAFHHQVIVTQSRMDLGNIFNVLRGEIGEPIFFGDLAFHMNKYGLYGLAASVLVGCSRSGLIVRLEDSLADCRWSVSYHGGEGLNKTYSSGGA